MRQRALGGGKLHYAKCKRRHRGEGVDLDDRLSSQQWRKRHSLSPHAPNARAALNPETKRDSVVEVAPRGSMTSISENRPRRATARSSASRSCLRVATPSPVPPTHFAM